MSSTTKIAIAGMTGRFARLIIKHLLDKPNVEITGFCRDPSKIPSDIASDPRVTIFAASSTDVERIREAIRGADICICCYLGDNSLMEGGQKLLIDACIAEHIPRYMDSGFTFDYRHLEKGAAPQKDFCKNVQEYLEQRQDCIKAVQILNGAFMEVCFAPFYGLFNPDGPTIRYWGTGDEKLEMTTYDDAAKFAAEVAMDEDVVGFQTVLGDRKSAKEIAAAIDKQYGVHLAVERLGSLEDLHKQMKITMAENPQNMYAWMGMNYNYYGLNGSTYLPTPLDMDRYPNVRPTKLEEMLKRCTVDTLSDSYIF